MKKTKFYIYISNNGKAEASLVSGYAETINGLPIGVHKTGKAWTVSELSTGLKVTDGRTRADAMNKVLPAIDKISNLIKKDVYDNARNVINAAYGI